MPSLPGESAPTPPGGNVAAVVLQQQLLMPAVAGKEAEGLAQRKAARMEPDGEEAGRVAGAKEEKGLFSRLHHGAQDSAFDASCMPLSKYDFIHRTRRKFMQLRMKIFCG